MRSLWPPSGWAGGAIGTPEFFEVQAGFGAEEFEAVADGSDGAAAGAGDFGDGHLLDTIEAKDGEDGGRAGRGGGIEAIEEQKRVSKS